MPRSRPACPLSRAPFGPRTRSVPRLAAPLAALLVVGVLPSGCQRQRSVAEIVADMMQHTGPERQRLAIELGAHGRDAIPAWIRLLENSQKDYALYVLSAAEIGAKGADAAAAVPVLAGYLRDGFAGKSQGDMTVQQRLETPDAARAPARSALALIGAPAVEPVVALLDHKVGRVRQESALTLGQIGAAASSSVPRLVTLLGDADHAVAASAAWSIGEIGRVDHGIVLGLSGSLQHPEPLVRRAVLEALGKLGPKAGAVRGAVEKVVRDANEPPFVRETARATLARLAAAPGAAQGGANQGENQGANPGPDAKTPVQPQWGKNTPGKPVWPKDGKGAADAPGAPISGKPPEPERPKVPEPPRDGC